MTTRLLCLMLFASLTLPPRSEAHPDQQNAMWMLFEPSQIHLAVDVSLKELSAVWGVSEKSQIDADHSELIRASEQHQAYLLDHLAISADKQTLTGQILKVSQPSKIEDPEKTFVQYEIVYPLPHKPVKVLQVRHDMLGERLYSPGIPWNIRYIVRTKHSDASSVSSWLLSKGEPLDLMIGTADDVPKTKTAPQEPSAPSLIKTVRQALQRFLGF